MLMIPTDLDKSILIIGDDDALEERVPELLSTNGYLVHLAKKVSCCTRSFSQTWC